ncbi:Uncharacterised protein [Mycobacteroides abscessus subsp. massiliense]|nr:Uncharacterised protein [Mycobacteroides abscessus subsp. massiliense]
MRSVSALCALVSASSAVRTMRMLASNVPRSSGRVMSAATPSFHEMKNSPMVMAAGNNTAVGDESDEVGAAGGDCLAGHGGAFGGEPVQWDVGEPVGDLVL